MSTRIFALYSLVWQAETTDDVGFTVMMLSQVRNSVSSIEYLGTLWFHVWKVVNVTSSYLR